MPRRGAWWFAPKVYERQPDSEERVRGPAKNAPAAAVAGFAKKQGVSPRTTGNRHPGKGRKLQLSEQDQGRATNDILAEALRSWF